MSLVQVSRATLRRAMRNPRVGAARRGLATEEPQVSWSEYRSGKKTFADWVDANRHVVAGSFFAFYVSLAVWKFGGKKKPVAEVVDAIPQGGETPEEGIPELAKAADGK